jgi:hypothetical protein
MIDYLHVVPRQQILTSETTVDYLHEERSNSLCQTTRTTNHIKYEICNYDKYTVHYVINGDKI